MQAAMVLTMGFFERHLKPLAELNIKTFEAAVLHGVLTAKEAGMISAMIRSDLVPSLEEFMIGQRKSKSEMQWLAMTG